MNDKQIKSNKRADKAALSLAKLLLNFDPLDDYEDDFQFIQQILPINSEGEPDISHFSVSGDISANSYLFGEVRLTAHPNTFANEEEPVSFWPLPDNLQKIANEKKEEEKRQACIRQKAAQLRDEEKRKEQQKARQRAAEARRKKAGTYKGRTAERECAENRAAQVIAEAISRNVNALTPHMVSLIRNQIQFVVELKSGHFVLVAGEFPPKWQMFKKANGVTVCGRKVTIDGMGNASWGWHSYIV